MSGLGELLRQARLEKGLTLDQLQEITKIRGRYLEALEKGNFAALPGNFYARAFVKNVCEVLGLDTQQVFEQFKGELPAVQSETSEPIRHSRPKTKSPSPAGRWLARGLFYTFVVLILVLMYTFVLQNADTKNQSNPPITSPGVSPNTTEAGKQSEKPSAPVTPPNTTTAPSTSPPAAPANQPVVSYSKTIPGKRDTDVYTVKSASQIELTLKATQGDCWFQLKQGDPNGKVILMLTLKKGEQKTFTLSPAGFLSLGNPRAVELIVNGYPINTSGMKTPRNFQINLVQK